MTRINQIWEELENDMSITHGLVLRRYSGTFLPDVYIAVKRPESYRCLASSIDESRITDLKSFSNLQDISVELIPDEYSPGKKILLLKLLSKQHQDIFSILCEDLLESISTVTNESQLITELLRRFEKWKSLFEKVAAQGLTREEQRGLYGELKFLQKLLQRNTDFNSVLKAWNGPEGSVKDFSTDIWGVEVKTSIESNPKKILISSEQQLDIDTFANLFLFHINIEEKASGETLNKMVDNIINLLHDDSIPLNRFRNKLLEAGYYTQHLDLYEAPGYIVRKEICYLIGKEFPRIEKSDIRDGVEDVKYSICIQNCLPFITDEDTLFNTINIL